MIDSLGFKKWLFENTTFSNAVVSDVSSRVKRADRIIPFDNDDYYQFKLENNSDYKSLSVSVRSQIKRAVALYKTYVQSNNDE